MNKVKHHTIAFIGTAKNAGKTTALNAFLKTSKTKKIAITSIGLDGEKLDQLTNQEKPSIHAYRGMMVATAKDTLSKLLGSYKILEELPMQTPLGKIVLIELLEDSDLLVAGPSSLHELKQLKETIKTYHLDHFYIDGALFRKSSAASQLADAMVVSTGASLNQNMKTVIKQTKQLIETMNLPRKEIEEIEQTKLVLQDRVIYDEGDFLANPSSLLAQAKDAKELHIKGAITNRLIAEMIKQKRHIPPLEIVLNDFTMIQADLPIFQKLFLLKHQVKTVHHTPLLLLTINPTSPYFEGFDPMVFEEEMNKALDYVQVIDLKRKELSL